MLIPVPVHSMPCFSNPNNTAAASASRRMYVTVPLFLLGQVVRILIIPFLASILIGTKVGISSPIFLVSLHSLLLPNQSRLQRTRPDISSTPQLFSCNQNLVDIFIFLLDTMSSIMNSNTPQLGQSQEAPTGHERHLSYLDEDGKPDVMSKLITYLNRHTQAELAPTRAFITPAFITPAAAAAAGPAADPAAAGPAAAHNPPGSGSGSGIAAQPARRARACSSCSSCSSSGKKG
ncbi:hypothetical protein B0T20DRAFT_427503 [Sordaria brevicollis]|uniref:Uncharacterized protein n=1 Tax=Sordaria brevicollis TaxID=83679 RepID=A0AAE0U0F0_SORBR|nr:hypothetical protein B0T20DRAFT_427503 [Sordaria brevicollis]